MIKLEKMGNEQFRICMETISRMGVLKKSVKEPDRKLFFQSCYVVKIKGDYYITYYKEILNKKMEGVDYARMNTIALLLSEKWKLAKLVDPSIINEYGSLPSIFVVPYKDKNKYEKRNKLTSKHLSDFIQIQIRKMEIENAEKESKNLKNDKMN
jgi:hypothetical protein